MTEPYTPAPESGVDEDVPVVTSPSYVQLTQQRVRLGRAAEAFATPDDAGRYPIIVLVKSGGRFQVQVLLIAGAVAAAAVALPVGPVLTIAGLVLAVGLLIGGSARAVLVPVPEGTQAIMVQAGKLLQDGRPGSPAGAADGHGHAPRDDPRDPLQHGRPGRAHRRRRARRHRDPVHLPDRGPAEVRLQHDRTRLRRGLPGGRPDRGPSAHPGDRLRGGARPRPARFR